LAFTLTPLLWWYDTGHTGHNGATSPDSMGTITAPPPQSSWERRYVFATPPRVRVGPADPAGVRPRGAFRLGSGGRAGSARGVPVPSRRLPLDVHRAGMDHAPVRRLRHRGGVQPAVPPADRGRHHGPFGGFRPAYPDGLRLGRPSGPR